MTLTLMRKFSIYFIVPAILLSSCSKRDPAYIELAGKAQGTTFSIIYEDSYQRDFSEPIDSIFRIIDKSMSLWDSTSLITRINRNETDSITDTHFSTVWERSKEVWESTSGSFDPTVGPLVKAWGFSFKKGLPPPDSMEVDSLKDLVGLDKIRFENSVLNKEVPDMELDFNAIAQGYTVDLISAFLEKKGIRNYMVELGGEVRASGVNERDTTWVIGIDKPVESEDKERSLQTTVALKNKSLATSGSYRKYFEQNGKKYSHVIDPSTGYPVKHQMLSISVIADDCTTADAYATAFMVMGMDRAFETALDLDMEIYCIYSHDNGSLSVRSTPGFGK